MDNNSTYNIYNDIAKRTNGEIYIGVVGPVRTGKSTFIKRFMELMVIPAITDENSRIRAVDELPQASAGKTVMTTEPKFIPKDAISVSFDAGVSMKVRLIDCVGYMVKGAEGHMEEGRERLVETPWHDYDIPFTKAAEMGTEKVINEHSTLGIVVTNDGTITDIARENYIVPEKRTIDELKKIGKPFVVILNSVKPESPETKDLAEKLSEEYGAAVIPVNCDQLKEKDVYNIFESMLMDFPVSEVCFSVPAWAMALDVDNPLRAHLIENAGEIFSGITQIRDVKNLKLNPDDYIEKVSVSSVSLSDGVVHIKYGLYDSYYYEILSSIFGTDINNEYDFIREVKELAAKRSECSKVSDALASVSQTGYGSVSPEQSEITLLEPEIIKSGNKYGVKIKAVAPSVHLIKADVTTEIAPIVGSEEQAKDLIKYIKEETEDKNENIWGVSIFGKTIRQLVDDGMNSKVNKINPESRKKLQDTMEKIVNDSNGGMVCIII